MGAVGAMGEPLLAAFARSGIHRSVVSTIASAGDKRSSPSKPNKARQAFLNIAKK